MPIYLDLSNLIIPKIIIHNKYFGGTEGFKQKQRNYIHVLPKETEVMSDELLLRLLKLILLWIWLFLIILIVFALIN